MCVDAGCDQYKGILNFLTKAVLGIFSSEISKVNVDIPKTTRNGYRECQRSPARVLVVLCSFAIHAKYSP